MFSWRSPRSLPVLVAHRGSSTLAPENTLAAFQQALTDGADAIELDVRLSHDSEVVVIHDARLERTTNGHGKVKDCSLRDLKRLSAGAWFHKRFSAERIPTLDDVFECVGGKMGVNIEIKTEPSRRLTGEIVERCIHIVRRHRASGYVMISSFHHPFVNYAKALDPGITAGVLYHPLRHYRRTPGVLIAAANADFFICHRNAIRGRNILRLHKNGFLVGVYTVDTKKSLEHMLGMGVDCVFSNDPGKMKRELIQK
jgi:glycerophosphoryl diester phosphodiesterase